MVLAVIALILSLAGPGEFAAQSMLPSTQPGLSPNEGVFLVTTADDGSQAMFFVAQNVRHSILPSDAQKELQLNPLWPIRAATHDEVLAYPEGAPLGGAKAGLIAVKAAVPAAAVAPEPQPTYVLQPGDNLTQIANKYGTNVDAILAANGLSDANRIYAGQSLVIPTDTAAADQPAAADDSSAADDTSADTTYTVARGDSAFAIARRFGVSQDDLLAANNISNPDRVYAGQVLTIPAGSS